jgi:hypothetical protein
VYEAKRIIGIAALAAAVSLGAILFSAVLARSALAASTAADKATASPKVRALATSLAEEWLKEQGVAIPAAAAPTQPADPSFEDYLNSAAGAVHGQIIDLANAVPELPGEFEQAAARITVIDPDSGRGQILLDLGIFGDPTWWRHGVSRPRLRLLSISQFS